MSSGKKGQIDSDKIVIGEVFSRFWFRIPDYQRAYVWGKDEISELIEDVNYASEHNPEGQYFLGSMVLRKAARTMDGVSFEEYELLDGAIYGRRSARYVLLRLEYLLASHAAPLNLPDEISVEHIMPQTPGKTSQWLKDFGGAARCVVASSGQPDAAVAAQKYFAGQPGFCEHTGALL